MSDYPDYIERRLSRRNFLKAGVVVATMSPLLIACGSDDEPPAQSRLETPPPPTDEEEEEVEATEPTDDAGAVEADEPVAVGEGLREVPRNRTLLLRWAGVEGRFVDHELWNPYAVGGNHQNGSNLFHEPLAYYSAFADEEILWLAEDYEYNDDSTELRIVTRSGVVWSDGEPFSAEDVAFTIDSLREIGSTVRWGSDVQQIVESAEAVSDNEVVVSFSVPSPRFFYFMTYKYDIGVYMVPKHIYEQVDDWSAFTHFDVENDWPVTTSPWRVVFSSPEQKIVDRRDTWWAIDAGMADRLPAMERIVYLPFGGEDQTAQAHITNQIDTSSGLTPATMELILRQNPALTTHSGSEPPYGYVDWWPMALYLNNEVEPWGDVRLRWAVSYYLDREQIIEIAENGAGSLYPLFIPSYPGLTPYVDSVRDILEEYDTLAYDPARADALMEEAGYTKNGQGMWEKDGQVLALEMNGATGRQLLGPVVAEQLRRAGIDATFAMPPDWGDRFSKGDFEGGFNGHGGSVSGDPYYSLRLYQSATEAIPGAHQVNFSRWNNPEYDAIVDEMAVTPTEDTDALMDQFRRAMEIWIPELPSVQINEFYHRIPMNTTYWTNWPTEDNNYVNGASWHLTWAMVVNALEAVQ